MTHGYKRYSSKSDPCRCQECRAAKAAYMRNKRAEAKRYAKQLVAVGSRYVADIDTHGYAGYQDYGCRCPICTEAKARRYQAQRQ